jgi:hypothetical protein
MHKISKRDIFGGQMGEERFAAGRAMEQRMFREGRFQSSTIDSDDLALKTWILWRDGPLLPNGKRPTIECEIHRATSRTTPGRQVVTLHVACPFCLMNFNHDSVLLVDEENKPLSVEAVEYGKLPKSHHMVQQWDEYVVRRFARSARDDDKLFLVSSPDRWMCDYCKGWCVRVQDSIATTDTSGATIMFMDLASATPKR